MTSIYDINTPAFVIDLDKLKTNLELLKSIKEETKAKILLAQKAYSCFYTYPLIAKYLDGTTASGIYEARLGYEEFKKEVHIFSPAYKAKDMEEIVKIAKHIVFNSFSQLALYAKLAKENNCEIALRINPECSTQTEHEIYDPCSSGSRLGVRIAEFEKALESKEGRELYSMLDGLHFHTLCEQNSDDLHTTLQAVEQRFGKYLPDMRWLNFGGGHHITRKDYDVELLKECIAKMRDNYNLSIYLEPGEAVVLNAGYLVATVIDVVEADMPIAILDTSAACHMPDVIEMPYRPPLKDSALPHEKEYTYRLAGPTCLAGDVIGEYSFDKALKVGDRLIFEDMALYTMVKTNTFNGMPLPDINIMEKGECSLIKSFSYDDFKMRLS